jgi:hypothetical protein
MAKWEYSVITINAKYEVTSAGNITDSTESLVIIGKHLNAMGKDGWELVSFLPAMLPQKLKGNESANSWMYHAIFKRQSKK